MAKFNRGQVGGVSYEASPVGFRKYLWLYKVIPYLVGYDVKVALMIKQGEANTPWNRGVLLTKPPDDRPANKPFSLDYENGKMVKECHICHPSQRGQFTCKLFLEETQQTADGTMVCVGQVQTEIIEDLRVESLYTVIAWTMIAILIPIVSIVFGVLVRARQ